MSSAPLAGGCYEVHAEIGVGGMATVHLGRRRAAAGFSRVVAIKRLHPHLAKDPEIATMFLDEARLASRIDHPNVVSIVDVVESGPDVSLVMAYVAGFSLDRVLARAKQPTPVPVALRVAHDTLLGLRAAHHAADEHGVPLRLVHRDISPHNLLVGADGSTRVLDFGVAKADGRLQHRTRTNETKGKVAYMAPEQVLCEAVDARTDLHAVGVCLWEMLAGRRAHEGPEPAIMRAVLERTLPLLAEASRALGSTDALIARATAKERSERFASAAEMLSAVEAIGVEMASHEAVAAWLRGHLQAALEQRAALVAQMESNAETSEPLRAAEDATPIAVTPASAPAAPRRPSSIVIGAVVASAVVAGWLFGPWRQPSETVTSSSASDPRATGSRALEVTLTDAASPSSAPGAPSEITSTSNVPGGTSALSTLDPRVPTTPSAPTIARPASPTSQRAATALPATPSVRRETLF